MPKYVVFEDTKQGRKILGKGETADEAKVDWFRRTEREDPIKALTELPMTEVRPYDGVRIYGRVMCGKVEPAFSHVSIDHDNPRILRDGEFDQASFIKARLEAAERELEREARSVRWYIFSRTWYGKLLIKFGLA